VGNASPVNDNDSPFSRVPEPGVREMQTPYTDAHAEVAFSGAVAHSLKPLPLAVRIIIVVLGIAAVVGIPLLILLTA
jgi:hypothetical protein